MADWRWEVDPKDLLDDLSSEALDQVERLAREILVRDSMVFLKGTAYTGPGPGLRTESRGPLLVTYLTDVRGGRIVTVQVAWFG